jgi:hypothetical protein
LQERVEGLPRDDLDESAEDVEALARLPRFGAKRAAIYGAELLALLRAA